MVLSNHHREVFRRLEEEALENGQGRRNSVHPNMSRFRMQKDCDESGKRFDAIEVLPRFL